MFDLLSSTGDGLFAVAALIWDQDPIAFKAGPLTFRWYGLLFAFGLLQGYYFLRRAYEIDGEDPDDAIALVYACIFGIIAGARLGHVFFYEADRYLADPVEIFKFWKGGLASHGATIGIIVTVFLYARVYRKVPMRVIADRMALTIPFATVCVRFGNFMNSEIVGRVTDGSVAVVFVRHDMLPRHPSQLYEVAMGIAVFIIVWKTEAHYRKKGEETPLGLLVSTMVAAYFTGRFGVEFFKEYQTLQPGGFTMGQYLSVPFAAVGFFGVWASLAGPWKGQKASDYLGHKKYAAKLISLEESDGRKVKGEARKAKKKTLAEVDAIFDDMEQEKAGGAPVAKAKKKKRPAPEPMPDDADDADDAETDDAETDDAEATAETESPEAATDDGASKPKRKRKSGKKKKKKS